MTSDQRTASTAQPTDPDAAAARRKARIARAQRRKEQLLAAGGAPAEASSKTGAPANDRDARALRRKRRAAALAAAEAAAEGDYLSTSVQVARAIRPNVSLSYFGFTMFLRPGADSSRLLVVLSTKPGFALFRASFGHDVLFVSDARVPYYVQRSSRLATAISRIADRFGYEKISIMGGSKAGFGALLIGGLLAQLKPERIIRILAFQPRVYIWPYEPERSVPGYHRAHAYAAANPERKESMRRNGNAMFVAELPNTIVKMIYSEHNVGDRAQSQLLTGPNVSHLPVPTAIHNAIAILNYVGKSDEDVRRGIERMLASVTEDEQEMAGGIDAETLRQDIRNASHLPSLMQLIEDSFSWELKPAPVWWPIAVNMRRAWREAQYWYYSTRPEPTIRGTRKTPADAANS